MVLGYTLFTFNWIKIWTISSYGFFFLESLFSFCTSTECFPIGNTTIVWKGTVFLSCFLSSYYRSLSIHFYWQLNFQLWVELRVSPYSHFISEKKKSVSYYLNWSTSSNNLLILRSTWLWLPSTWVFLCHLGSLLLLVTLTTFISISDPQDEDHHRLIQ